MVQTNVHNVMLRNENFIIKMQCVLIFGKMEHGYVVWGVGEIRSIF